MTLRMVAEQREDYGSSNHFDMRIYCDWCGERIRDLRDGVYCWRTDPASWVCIDGTIHHLHNGCATTFGTANSGDWGWVWERLMDLYMNLLGSLRPQGVRAQLRARGHLNDVLYDDAGEPGSEFRAVTQQESEQWAQEHPTIQLKEGQVYEAAVLLRSMDRAKQEMDGTLGELLQQIEPVVESPEEDPETPEPDDGLAPGRHISGKASVGPSWASGAAPRPLIFVTIADSRKGKSAHDESMLHGEHFP